MVNAQGNSIVLTGCGWVTSFGAGNIDEVLSAAAGTVSPRAAGGSGWMIPEALLGAGLELSSELKRDRGARIAATALEYARRSADVAGESLQPERVGLILGDAQAGQLGMINFATEVRGQTPRFVSPIHFPQTVGNYTAGALARAYSIRGPNATIASGISSGLDAIVEGCAVLARDEADVVYAGGTNSLSAEETGGLATDGEVFSEGACVFVLEHAGRAAERNAVPLASVAGNAVQALASEYVAKFAIISGTLPGPPGMVAIEHWTGRCLGAMGAACAAAAIGAMRGFPVPAYADSTTDNNIVTERMDVSGPGEKALVWALTNGGQGTSIELQACGELSDG